MIRAIAEALFVTEAPGAPIDDAYVTNIDGFMSPASKTLRFGLLFMLDVLRWLPVLVVRRLAAFDEMPAPARTEMLARMDRSRISVFPLMVVGFKTMLTIAYYEDDARLRALGYPGDSERKRWRVSR